MMRRSIIRRRRRSTLVLFLAAVAFVAPAVRAQEPTADVLQRFEERLRALEDENRALREQVRSLAESRSSSGASGAATDEASEESSGPPFSDPAPDDASPLPADAPAVAGDPEAAVDSGAPISQVGPTAPTANSRGRRRRIPLDAALGQGFEFTSDDDEFQLQFHNETQVDYRYFDHTGQGTVHDGFFLPRQIWTFNGRFTRRLEYLTSFQRGLGGFELRDAILNFKVLDEDRLMIKVGRFRVPYTYEFYSVSNPDLISPERSVFAINFSNIREIGGMVWGTFGDDRIDYAVGLFNGVRNGFEETNDDPSMAAFFNARPFRRSTRFEFLNYLNVGASTETGNQTSTSMPPPMRTSVNSSLASGASTASPAFLAFNSAAREDGMRMLGAVHASWFYRRLSLIAEYDFGATNYIPHVGAEPYTRIQVPVSGYHVQAGWFLTGEHVTRRGPVEIRKPFNLRPGADFGLGAFELGARYAVLRMGDEVFSGGLADPNLWSNDVQVTDVGINWYLNQYLKVYLDWQRSEFGSPVSFGPGRSYVNSDLYWARLQFLF